MRVGACSSTVAAQVVRDAYLDNLLARPVSEYQHLGGNSGVLAGEQRGKLQECVAVEDLEPTVDVDSLVPEENGGQDAPGLSHNSALQAVRPGQAITDRYVASGSNGAILQSANVGRHKLAVSIAETDPVVSRLEAFTESSTQG